MKTLFIGILKLTWALFFVMASLPIWILLFAYDLGANDDTDRMGRFLIKGMQLF